MSAASHAGRPRGVQDALGDEGLRDVPLRLGLAGARCDARRHVAGQPGPREGARSRHRVPACRTEELAGESDVGLRDGRALHFESPAEVSDRAGGESAPGGPRGPGGVRRDDRLLGARSRRPPHDEALHRIQRSLRVPQLGGHRAERDLGGQGPGPGADEEAGGGVLLEGAVPGRRHRVQRRGPLVQQGRDLDARRGPQRHRASDAPAPGAEVRGMRRLRAVREGEPGQDPDPPHAVAASGRRTTGSRALRKLAASQQELA
jgi:hypothetical protein